MKIVKIWAFAALLFASATVSAQTKTEKIKVFGNCGMCKNRIEKGLKSDSAITAAAWDKATKFLTVTYDAKKTNAKAIAGKVAALGHDNAMAKASDAVYAKLPGCCKYDRTGLTEKSH